jgi:hypothetical protein
MEKAGGILFAEKLAENDNIDGTFPTGIALLPLDLPSRVHYSRDSSCLRLQWVPPVTLINTRLD